MLRILRPGGVAALVWNDRDTRGTAFLRELEALLVAHCPSYPALQGKADAFGSFDVLFGEGAWSRRVLPNEQRLDEDGLVARVASASYAPKRGTREHEDIVAALRSLFARHADTEAKVRITYATVLVWGRPYAT